MSVGTMNTRKDQKRRARAAVPNSDVQQFVFWNSVLARLTHILYTSSCSSHLPARAGQATEQADLIVSVAQLSAKRCKRAVKKARAGCMQGTLGSAFDDAY